MTTLREAAQQALRALEMWVDETQSITQQDAITALRAALAQQQAKPQGCDHCNHPLYAATKCRVCGRVTEPKAQEPTPPPEARTEAEKTAYAAGWWDALRKAQQAEPVQELPQRKPLTEEEVFSIFRTSGSPVAFARAIEHAHGIKE